MLKFRVLLPPLARSLFLQEEGFCAPFFLADSGFGLLADGALERERLKSEKQALVEFQTTI